MRHPIVLQACTKGKNLSLVRNRLIPSVVSENLSLDLIDWYIQLWVKIYPLIWTDWYIQLWVKTHPSIWIDSYCTFSCEWKPIPRSEQTHTVPSVVSENLSLDLNRLIHSVVSVLPLCCMLMYLSITIIWNMFYHPEYQYSIVELQYVQLQIFTQPFNKW